jgi:hypothetical protein
MGLAPERIEHLAQASYLLGHLKEEKIRQIGESVASVRTPFEVLHSFRRLRAGGQRRSWHSNCLA